MMLAGTFYLFLRFCEIVLMPLFTKFLPKKEGTELTDAQIIALKKEFTWIENEVIVIPVATYNNYTVFKCGQGHTAYVMFKGNKLVDVITFDFEVLVDEESGILFKLHDNDLSSGDFYIRRT
jgi:hypothetical protein